MSEDRQEDEGYEGPSEYRPSFAGPNSSMGGLLMGCGFLIATLGGLCAVSLFSSDAPQIVALSALFILIGIVMFAAGKGMTD